MNGRLDKVAMTNKLMQLKRELHYKCEIGEKNEGYCTGANDYLNRTFDVLDEYWQCLSMKKEPLTHVGNTNKRVSACSPSIHTTLLTYIDEKITHITGNMVERKRKMISS